MTYPPWFGAGLAVALCALTGCAVVGPDYHEPSLPTPPHFGAAPASGGKASIEPALWWHALGDAQLDALVTEAVTANLDLRIALTRLQEVRTEEAVLLGAALPEIEAAGGAANGTGSDTTRSRVPSLLTSADNTARTKKIKAIAGFDGGWEIDLFGQIRRAIEAGSYDAEAAAEARNAVLVTVIADMVRAYVDLRGLQIRMAVLRQDIDAEAELRDVVKQRFDRGLINELDLTLAERQLASLRAALAPLEAQRDAARNAIAVLLGRYPEDLGIDLTQTAPMPTLPDHVEAGLPLDLIKRRPDIRESERRLAAATARIGVATGNLFPRIALTGSIGVQFPGLANENGSHIWSLGPSAYWPLLDFGALDAQVDIADLRSQEQLIAYKRALLNAVREVDNAVSAFSGDQDRVKNLETALANAQRAVTLARQRYERGLTDFLNLADAERQNYGLEADLILAQQAAAEDFTALFKSLGGGWESYQQVPSVRLPHPALVAMFERLITPQPAEQAP